MNSPASLIRLTMLVAVFPVALIGAAAHSSASGIQTGGASISGRVTLGNAPAPNLAVGAQRIDSASSAPSGSMSKATTDQEGRYVLTGLAPGRYRVTTLSALYVLRGETQHNPLAGRTVTLNENEQVENIDLRVARGGVITGKVLDAAGRPLIGGYVTLAALDEKGRRRPLPPLNTAMYEIDDRGVYRIYGLPAGRYIVSAGQAADSIRPGRGGPIYRRTYHPDAIEEERARIVEIDEDREAAQIDIAMGLPAGTFEISGRVISAETGQPLADAPVGLSGLREGSAVPTNFGPSSASSNAEGEFRLRGLLPGRYVASLFNGAGVGAGGDAGLDYYSDPAPFEILDGDVSGIEIRVHRASGISGVIVAEDGDDRAVLSLASQMYVYAAGEPAQPMRSAQSRVRPDGSFHLRGLAPGGARISLGGLPGLQLVRVERQGGAGVGGGAIELAPGEQVTGMRLVVSYGTGVVRGEVKVAGGAMPRGARLLVSCRRVSGSGKSVTVAVDARGNFLFEKLSPGNYELTLVMLQPSPELSPLIVEQTVNVVRGIEARVTLALDPRPQQ